MIEPTKEQRTEAEVAWMKYLLLMKKDGFKYEGVKPKGTSDYGVMFRAGYIFAIQQRALEDE